MKRPTYLNQIISILILPFNVIITIPLILLFLEAGISPKLVLADSGAILLLLVGITMILIGILLLVITMNLFISIGKGTLAPWKPTQELVVQGPYQYVRNPMISGVLFILLGEVILFSSTYILGWLIVFFLINNIYFVLLEEPGLSKRFGVEYEAYKKNVPKWLPRLTPWKRNDGVLNKKKNPIILLPIYFIMLLVIFILPYYSAEGYLIINNTTSQLGCLKIPAAKRDTPKMVNAIL